MLTDASYLTTNKSHEKTKANNEWIPLTGLALSYSSEPQSSIVVHKL